MCMHVHTRTHNDTYVCSFAHLEVSPMQTFSLSKDSWALAAAGLIQKVDLKPEKAKWQEAAGKSPDSRARQPQVLYGFCFFFPLLKSALLTLHIKYKVPLLSRIPRHLTRGYSCASTTPALPHALGVHPTLSTSGPRQPLITPTMHSATCPRASCKRNHKDPRFCVRLPPLRLLSSEIHPNWCTKQQSLPFSY